MTIPNSFSAVWCLTSFSWLLILLLSECPAYWRWGTVNHELFPEQSWLSAHSGDLSRRNHLGVCLFFQEAHFAHQTSTENHLFLYGCFQSHLWLAGAREGQDDGTRGCKRTLAATTSCRAVGLPPPNPDKGTHWKMSGWALNIPLLLGALKTFPAVSKTCYSSYCWNLTPTFTHRRRERPAQWMQIAYKHIHRWTLKPFPVLCCHPDQPEDWSGRAFKISTGELGIGTVLHHNTHTQAEDWKPVTKPCKGVSGVIALPKHKTPLELAHWSGSAWQTAACLLCHASLITQLPGSELLCAQLAQFPGRASSAPPGREDTHLKRQLIPLGARRSLALGVHGLLPR